MDMNGISIVKIGSQISEENLQYKFTRLGLNSGKKICLLGSENWVSNQWRNSAGWVWRKLGLKSRKKICNLDSEKLGVNQRRKICMLLCCYRRESWRRRGKKNRYPFCSCSSTRKESKAESDAILWAWSSSSSGDSFVAAATGAPTIAPISNLLGAAAAEIVKEAKEFSISIAVVLSPTPLLIARKCQFGFFPENKPNGVGNRNRRIRRRRRLPENKFVWDADSLVGACKTKEQQLGFCRGARKSGPDSVHAFVATLNDERLPKSVATWAAQRKEGRKEGRMGTHMTHEDFSSSK